MAVNHLTVGRVPRGALVQASRPAVMMDMATLNLALYEPDFASAARLASVINMELGADSARALDAGSVRVQVPTAYKGNMAELIARLEPLPVQIDATARVAPRELHMMGPPASTGVLSMMPREIA